MKTRNPNLDLIKCIACTSAVGVHTIGMKNYTLYYLMDMSIPFFFMVNGYLMFSKKEIGYSYIAHKLLMILKIIFLWNFLITLPVMVFRHKMINPLTQCLNSVLQKGYLWHFWFFGALMLLYLLLPLLHRLLRSRLRLHVLCCCILFLCAAGISLYSMRNGYPLQAYVPQSLRLWSWLLFFLFGGLCTHISYEKFPFWAHGLLALLFTLASNFVQKKVGLYLIHNRLADLFYDEPVSALWFGLLFTFLMRIPIRDRFSRPISFCSSLNLGIYILHPLFLTALTAVYTPPTTFCAILIWAGLMILCGALSHVMLKIPYIRELITL